MGKRAKKPVLSRAVAKKALRETIADIEERIREWLAKDEDYPDDLDEFKPFMSRKIKMRGAPTTPEEITPEWAEAMDVLHLINHLRQARDWLDAGHPEAAAINMYYAGMCSGGLRDNRKHEVLGHKAALLHKRRRELSVQVRRDDLDEAKKQAGKLYRDFLAKRPGTTKATAYQHVAGELRKTPRTVRKYITGK